MDHLPVSSIAFSLFLPHIDPAVTVLFHTRLALFKVVHLHTVLTLRATLYFSRYRINAFKAHVGHGLPQSFGTEPSFAILHTMAVLTLNFHLNCEWTALTVQHPCSVFVTISDVIGTYTCLFTSEVDREQNTNDRTD